MAPDELRRRASTRRSRRRRVAAGNSRVPVVAKTAVKDAREWQRARAFRVDPSGPWRGHDVACVWQRHELFHTAGHATWRARSACRRSCSCPRRSCGRRGSGECGGRVGAGGSNGPASRRRCAAPTSSRAGRRRSPSRSRRIGVDDRPHRHHADRRRSRAVRAPRPIATRRVRAARARRPVRRRLDRQLPAVPRARAGGRRARRPRRRDVAARRRRAGARAHRAARARARRRVRVHRHRRRTTTIPEYLAAMDVGLVLAPADAPFHYSPLKLAEYLAAGLAGDRAARRRAARRSSTTASTRCSCAPGDRDELARGAAAAPATIPPTRERLGPGRAAAAAERWSWDRSVERVLGARRHRADADRHAPSGSRIEVAPRALALPPIRSRGSMAATQPYRNADGLRVDRHRTAAAAPVPRRALGPPPVHLAPRAHRPQGRALRLGDRPALGRSSTRCCSRRSTSCCAPS